MGETVRFGVSMDRELLDLFDSIISSKGYSSRSEAIRDLIRGMIVEERWKTREGEMMGVLIVVYDHTQRELCSRLTREQHHHGDLILCTLHFHIDEVNCMETTVFRGRAEEIKKAADELSSLKGIKYSKFVFATTGQGLP